MGFLESLTIVFIALKLFGVISWGWFAVFLPLIIACVIYAVILMFFGAVFLKVFKGFWRG